jgi:23S rRNA pseudouridine2605 synthase
MHEGERLQKVLAAAGLGSRRKCEEIIAAGRVQVNGLTAALGDRVDVSRDSVSVDNIPVELAVEKRYFLLNKPAGYITTMKDTRGRATVMELIKEEGRLFPVGRLDRDTRGLLLITNDGYLTHKLLHPSRGVEKTYVVKAAGRLSARVLSRLRRGISLDDGKTAEAKVKVLSQDAEGCILEMTIHEGRKRQIRRMCSAVGLEVADLIRTRFGPLDLAGLEEGSYRPLREDEVQSLRELEEGGP